MQQNKNSRSIYLKLTTLVVIILAIVIVGLILINSSNSTNLLNSTNPNCIPVKGNGVTNCGSANGFFCRNVLYDHKTANIIVSVGQFKGNWTSANFVFVPQGTPANSFSCIPDISFISSPANTAYATTGIPDGTGGYGTELWLPVNGVIPPIPVGTRVNGIIWVQYTTSGNNTPQYAQVGEINYGAS